MSKYRSVRTKIDGRTFASKKEAKRYSELLVLERSGRIRELECHPKFVLEVNGQKICTYIADFQYYEMRPGLDGWANDEEALHVVEDVKGVRTSVYRIKAKLMKACLGIEIRET